MRYKLVRSCFVHDDHKIKCAIVHNYDKIRMTYSYSVVQCSCTLQFSSTIAQYNTIVQIECVVLDQ